jgi:phenylpropionate dioxygenase-like ring-hydroxylating dioxygenase large terminal subunit
MNGQVRAFHNICRHRGNKLVWTDFPREETSGTCRQFTCKYHGWRYNLDGACTFVQQESEFFDLDKNDFGLVPVQCDVWEGFIFVNLAKEPEQSLREFLGPMITALEGYPFDKLTERWYFRSDVTANWKLYMDAFQEFYHAPVLHANQSPSKVAVAAREAGFEAPHYQIDGPHRLVSTAGIRAWELDDEMRKPIEGICRSGLFGPWEQPDLGIEKMPAGLNPAGCDPWGLDSFQLFPNFTILIWGQGWYLTYHYWPTSFNSHVFEGTLYFVPAKTPRARVAHELAAASFKEFGLQDANTLEATQSMLESRVVDLFPLGDQEVLCRHLHMETAKWVDEYLRGGVTVGQR